MIDNILFFLWQKYKNNQIWPTPFGEICENEWPKILLDVYVMFDAVKW